MCGLADRSLEFQIRTRPEIRGLYEAAAANTIVDELLSREVARLRRESGLQEGIHGEKRKMQSERLRARGGRQGLLPAAFSALESR